MYADRYYIATCIKVKRRVVKGLVKFKGKESNMLEYLKSRAVDSFPVVVPKYCQSLRVKSVTEAEFTNLRSTGYLEEVEVSGKTLLFGAERLDLNNTIGVSLLSSVRNHPKADETRVSFGLCSLLQIGRAHV